MTGSPQTRQMEWNFLKGLDERGTEVVIEPGEKVVEKVP